MSSFKGGCSCGAVRFELSAPPLWTNVCHCNACKRRTGSAFGLSAVCDPASVREFSGPAKSFVRHGESGKMVRYDFCPECGTTLRWYVELIPDWLVFAVGTFDDPRQFEFFGEMFADEALDWVRTGCEFSRKGAANQEFRDILIAKARAAQT
jgi:hypothetical protein